MWEISGGHVGISDKFGRSVNGGGGGGGMWEINVRNQWRELSVENQWVEW